MTRRTRWLAIAIFMIVGLTAGSAVWVYSGAAAQRTSGTVEEAPTVSLSDIGDLSRLELDFGGTQNSLVLKLKGAPEEGSLLFVLDRDVEEATVITGYNGTGRGRQTLRADIVRLTYMSQFQTHLSYALSGEAAAEEGISLPSLCAETPTIILETIQEYEYEKVKGYDPSWKHFDVSSKELKAAIKLPLLNNATANLNDDCFILEADLELEAPADKPMFVLRPNPETGYNPAITDSCSGLQVFGRGEDNLHKPNIIWHCRDDVNFSNDDDENAFAFVETAPFDSYYIFVEHGRDGNGDCGGRILLDRAGFEAAELYVDIEWQDWHDNCQDGQFDSDKEDKRSERFKVINSLGGRPSDPEATPGEEEAPPAIIEGLNPGDTGVGIEIITGGGGSVEQTCEFQWRGVGFSWILCWAFNGISEGLEVIEARAYEELVIDRADYQEQFSSGTNEFSYKDGWANIRNVMTFAIVGTALFMVISTALDIGFFSNYTVKKYLPRLIVGTILIQFSWALGDLSIQLTNQMGDLLNALLFSAFPGAKDHGLEAIFEGGGFIALTGLGAAVAVGAYSAWGLLLPAGFSGLVMLTLGFLFLIIRKWLIILLLILAPLGLAFWILPGNDRAWGAYSKTFLYLLLFYPIVRVTIAAGKIFSYLILLGA